MSNFKQDSKSTLFASAAALSIIIASVGGNAFAQTTNEEDKAKTTTTAAASETIVVKGVRASQQTAISRKKNANTAMDSIVAEDVGAFPDRNIGEAISRVSGVALDRGDFGDGAAPTIRGSSADLNRVEMDGLSAVSNGPNDRTTDLRYLSSDMIKSVDIIKGSTAEITEGGLGGTVRITTRTGLDFAKPYLSLRVGAQNLSLDDEWTPDVNLVASRKFLQGKLGVLVNITHNDLNTRGHMARVSNNNAGYFRAADYDNSPEKTYQLRSDLFDAAVNPVLWKTVDIASKVTNKADCNTAFAGQTALGFNNVAQNLNNALSIATCTNQWGDYIPSLPRYSNWFIGDQRSSADIRFDYKVTEDLNVYFKYGTSTRSRHYQDNNFSVGTPSATNIATSTIDANHFMTSFVLNSATPALWGGVSMDARDFTFDIDTKLLTGGFNYKKGPWRADLVLGHTESANVLDQNGIGYFYQAPGIKGSVTSSGLWTYEIPSGFDQGASSSYSSLLAATAAAQPQFSRTFTYQYTRTEDETSEDTAKFDLSRKFTKDEIPFLTRLATGFNIREYNGNSWNGANSLSPVAGVTVPRTIVRSSFRACQPTTTSTVACPYGLVYGTGVTAKDSTLTMTQAQLDSMVASTLIYKDGFYEGDPNRGDLLTGWYSVDVKKALSYVDQSGFNANCLRTCTGSDGKVYEMPKQVVNEQITSAYFIAEFAQDLPFNLKLDGNAGTRYVNTQVNATGIMTLTNITKNSNWDATTNFNAVTTTSLTRNVSLEGESTDWMPSYNLALRALDGKLVARWYNGKVISRPRAAQMYPGGTCTFDARVIDQNLESSTGDDIDLACTRTGNPSLKPFNALNRNYSLEFYLNRDTQFSISRYKNSVRVGSPINFTFFNVDLFGDGNEFTVPSYINGPGGLNQGWEYSTKMAFTSLPWKLKYTGLDANYTKSEGTAITMPNPLTGEQLPPQFQAPFSANASLWYDDGKLNARIAYQVIDQYLLGVAGNTSVGVNNYPVNAYDGWVTWNGTTGALTRAVNQGLPFWRPRVEYIDAKASYKVNKHFEIYIEGKNLTDTTSSRIQTGASFADGTPLLMENAYPGRRINLGFIYKH